MLDKCIRFCCALYVRMPVRERGFIKRLRVAQYAQVMLRHVLHPHAGFADSESDRTGGYDSGLPFAHAFLDALEAPHAGKSSHRLRRTCKTH